MSDESSDYSSSSNMPYSNSRFFHDFSIITGGSSNLRSECDFSHRLLCSGLRPRTALAFANAREDRRRNEGVQKWMLQDTWHAGCRGCSKGTSFGPCGERLGNRDQRNGFKIVRVSLRREFAVQPQPQSKRGEGLEAYSRSGTGKMGQNLSNLAQQAHM